MQPVLPPIPTLLTTWAFSSRQELAMDPRTVRGDAAEINVNQSKAPATSEAIKDVNGNDSGLEITKSEDGNITIDGTISGDTKVDLGSIVD